jgi:hypothetical protein
MFSPEITEHSQKIASAKLAATRRKGVSMNLDNIVPSISGLENQNNGLSLNIKMEIDEERIKTESDERLKSDERRLLKLELETKTHTELTRIPSISWKKAFLNLFKRNRKENKSENYNMELSTAPKKSIMKSFFIKRRKDKDKNQTFFEHEPPTPKRIKELWGIARKRVYYAIKLVERYIFYFYA